jgi:ankyrin repeat protein/TPR repeat protein/predicted acylesterase/phospholipase RssA
MSTSTVGKQPPMPLLSSPLASPPRLSPSELVNSGTPREEAIQSSKITHPFPLQSDQLSRLQSIFQNHLPPDAEQLDPQERCFQAVVLACHHQQWEKIHQARDDLVGLRNLEGEHILNSLIETESKERITTILERDFHQILASGEFRLALHRAISLNRRDLIPLIMEYVGDEERDDKDRTPLILAIELGQHEIVQQLMRLGTSVKTRFKYKGIKLSPMLWAIIRGETACLDALVEHPHTSWHTRAKKIGSILHVAIHFGQCHVLEHLLKKYSDRVRFMIESLDHKDRTPLLLAASLGDLSSIYILYNKGANLLHQDRDGQTALHYAALNNHRDCIKLLCYLGADLNAKDGVHRIPFNVAPREETQALLRTLELRTNVEAREPPNFSQTPPQNLVFKGGGPRGIVHVGAVQGLERANAMSEVIRYAGTSAGAITAVLLAVGFTSQETADLLKTTSLMSFIDHPLKPEKIKEAIMGNLSIRGLWNTFNFVKGIVLKAQANPIGLGLDLGLKALKALWTTTGICPGEEFRHWIEARIREKTGIEYCTFGELRRLIQEGKTTPNGKLFKHLHVFGTKIGNNPEIGHFHSEVFGDEINSSDNLIISDTIRISMSIPGVFTPHKPHYKDQQGVRHPCEDRGEYVDGGLLNNLPIETFDFQKYRLNGLSPQEAAQPIFNRRTLAFSIFSPNKEEKEDKPIENVGQLLFGIARVFSQAETLIRNRNAYNQHRIVEIDNRGVGLLDFNLSLERQNELIESGAQAVGKFFESNAPLKTAPVIDTLIGNQDCEEGARLEKEAKFPEAYEAYKRGAERGNALSQIALGNCYFEGKGVKKSTSKAFEWYKKAHEQHCIDALYRMGLCYYQDRDYLEALKYFQQAQKLNHGPTTEFMHKDFYRNPSIAAICGNVEYLKTYLQQHGKECLIQTDFTLEGHDIEDVKCAPLHLATIFGQEAVVKFLLENYPESNVRDSKNYLAVHWAAKKGHVKILKALLKDGKSLNITGASGRTPLHMSVFNGQYKATELLLSRGSDINARAKQEHNNTPLHNAVDHLDLEMVEILIQNDRLDVNTLADGNISALYNAVIEGHLPIIRLIMGHRSWAAIPKDKKIDQLKKLLEVSIKFHKRAVLDYLKSCIRELSGQDSGCIVM